MKKKALAAVGVFDKLIINFDTLAIFMAFYLCINDILIWQ